MHTPSCDQQVGTQGWQSTSRREKRGVVGPRRVRSPCNRPSRQPRSASRGYQNPWTLFVALGNGRGTAALGVRFPHVAPRVAVLVVSQFWGSAHSNAEHWGCSCTWTSVNRRPAQAGFTSPAVRLSAAISRSESPLTTAISRSLSSVSAKCCLVASIALKAAGMATLKYRNDGGPKPRRPTQRDRASSDGWAGIVSCTTQPAGDALSVMPRDLGYIAPPSQATSRSKRTRTVAGGLSGDLSDFAGLQAKQDRYSPLGEHGYGFNVRKVCAHNATPNRTHGFHSVPYGNVVPPCSGVVRHLDGPAKCLSAHDGGVALFAATCNPARRNRLPVSNTKTPNFDLS
jgi:hypothetical protein